MKEGCNFSSHPDLSFVFHCAASNRKLAAMSVVLLVTSSSFISSTENGDKATLKWRVAKHDRPRLTGNNQIPDDKCAEDDHRRNQASPTEPTCCCIHEATVCNSGVL